MIISITSPKKGMGQTVTAINLSAALFKTIAGKVLLIDLNKYCAGVESYLSNTKITKGLDDFVSIHDSKLLDRYAFSSCVKKVYGIDIMASNICTQLREGHVNTLVEFAENSYSSTVLDTIGGENPLSKMFIKRSDVVIVLLSQSRHIIEKMISERQYAEYGEKVIFIVNKYMERHNAEKINYSMEEIEEQLSGAGYKGPKLFLPFDSRIINECNDHSVLNYVLNSKSTDGIYNTQLDKLIDQIRRLDGKGGINSTETKKKNRLMDIFALKGGRSFATE